MKARSLDGKDLEGTIASNQSASPDVAEHLRELRAEVAQFAEPGAEALSEVLARWLTAQYVAAARRAAEKAGGMGLDGQTLRGFCADVVALRQGDHSTARLEIAREWVAIERERTETQMRKQFEEWLKDPATKQRLCGEGLSPEERERRMREIFGLPEKQKGVSPETLKVIQQAVGLL